MTVEDGKENVEGNGNGNVPKLSSISKKGLLSSLREQGDDVEGTQEASTPKSNRGVGGLFTSSTPRSPGVDTLVGGVAALDLNPLRSNINKFLTPSRTFTRLRDEREELSRLTPSPPPHSFRHGFNLPMVGEVKPKVLVQFAKTWLRNPKNLALLVWGIGVTVSGAILFMVMVGMLNHVLPHRTERNTWFEVSNQIINALFTLMCLYLHPQRCLHLYMLIKWTPSHIIKLRTVYCKHGTRKPHEWGHMLVVVLLLQLNCFAQYALCGLNWGYKRSQRPAIGVGICLSLSFGAAAAAGIYTAISPLGKDFDLVDDTEELMQKVPHDSHEHEHQFVARTRIYRMLERRVSFAVRDEGVIVEKPDWKGGLFDITNEPPVSILSTLCCVCVFGWNMDRLGFGNRFVHIITFVLICTAPFWIFDLAALNIQNRYVRHAVGGTGIALCAFGLFYGGYWRIRMRERFKLPGNRFCCGKPAVTDCFQWLFFPLCSLCQEVRTAESYDVKDDRFYTRPHLGDPRSPPPGFASPHTPAPILSAVKEMPDPMSEMNLDDVELRGLESPYRESQPHHHNHHNKSPLAPPAPVTATRDSNFPSSDSPLRSSPSSPREKNPFFSTRTPPPSNRAFLGSHTSESPSRTSTSINPFLQPELYSSGNSLLRSPLRNPSNSTSS